MIDIRKEYKEEIARIVAAAEANEKEATENVAKCSAVLDEHENHLKDLVQESAGTLSQFSTACKKLRKLGKTVEPDPDFVTSTAEVFLKYGEIAKQLPEARGNVREAEDNLELAKHEENAAISMTSCLAYLKSYN